MGVWGAARGCGNWEDAVGDAVGGGRRQLCVCAEGNTLWGLENPVDAKNRQLTQQLHFEKFII